MKFFMRVGYIIFFKGYHAKNNNKRNDKITLAFSTFTIFDCLLAKSAFLSTFLMSLSMPMDIIVDVFAPSAASPIAAKITLMRIIFVGCIDNHHIKCHVAHCVADGCC
jgi:hypothetical protein